ncbi:MAG: 50S ribosomal protein L25 [Ignavibacteriae bacterium HGW-Ignavibacteriae-4]|nr:MAG: 50S ribosomal protein L25 [Ignavibacteriae bacterium HGW-Ignavibacteriae-4]
MKEVSIQATERIKKPGKFREKGFVPGVLYGDNIAATTSVKFEELALKKVLTDHGSNAKLWIEFNNNRKFGFIKAVQKDAITGRVIHIDVHLVSKEDDLRLEIPIVFKGEDDLKLRQLQLQVYKSEITVFGKMDLMVDAIYVDVSEKMLGDTITLNDLNFDKQLKVSEKEDEVYGIISNLRIQPTDTAAVDPI